MTYLEYVYDERTESQFSVEVITPEEIWDPIPKTLDGDLPWREFINYRLFIGVVARVGKEKKLVKLPLSSRSPVPDQRSHLHQEARRAGFRIRSHRWGDDLLVWRADYPIQFQKPVAVQDFYRRRQLRKMAGLSQVETARRVGMNYSTLCRFERGYERLSTERLKKLDEVLREAAHRVPDINQLVSGLDQ
jgi:DNA-binding XRE family transcriptional regulator